MDLNFNTLIALGAVALALLALATKMLDKGLSLREHVEFKESIKEQLLKITARQEERLVIREFNDWRTQVSRDFDRVEEDIRLIDATKPSAGELKEAMSAMDARVTHLEQMIRDLKRQNGH